MKCAEGCANPYLKDLHDTPQPEATHMHNACSCERLLRSAAHDLGSGKLMMPYQIQPS